VPGPAAAHPDYRHDARPDPSPPLKEHDLVPSGSETVAMTPEPYGADQDDAARASWEVPGVVVAGARAPGRRREVGAAGRVAIEDIHAKALAVLQCRTRGGGGITRRDQDEYGHKRRAKPACANCVEYHDRLHSSRLDR